MFAYIIISKLYIWPWLKRVAPEKGLFALSAIHLSRHLGSTVLVLFIVDPAVPLEWKNAVAYGILLLFFHLSGGVGYCKRLKSYEACCVGANYS
jgi:hypothetical protein